MAGASTSTSATSSTVFSLQGSAASSPLSDRPPTIEEARAWTSANSAQTQAASAVGGSDSALHADGDATISLSQQTDTTAVIHDSATAPPSTPSAAAMQAQSMPQTPPAPANSPHMNEFRLTHDGNPAAYNTFASAAESNGSSGSAGQGFWVGSLGHAFEQQQHQAQRQDILSASHLQHQHKHPQAHAPLHVLPPPAIAVEAGTPAGVTAGAWHGGDGMHVD